MPNIYSSSKYRAHGAAEKQPPFQYEQALNHHVQSALQIGIELWKVICDQIFENNFSSMIMLLLVVFFLKYHYVIVKIKILLIIFFIYQNLLIFVKNFFYSKFLKQIF